MTLTEMTQKIETTLSDRGFRNSPTLFSAEIVPDQVEHKNSLVVPANMSPTMGADFIDWDVAFDILIAYFVKQMDERLLVSNAILPDLENLMSDLADYVEVVPSRSLSANIRSAEGGQVVVLTLQATMNFCQNL
jgi:hypothetical protein